MARVTSAQPVDCWEETISDAVRIEKNMHEMPSPWETDPLTKNLAAMFFNHGEQVTRRVVQQTMRDLRNIGRMEALSKHYAQSAESLRKSYSDA